MVTCNCLKPRNVQFILSHVLSFPLVQGNEATALEGPHSIVITQEMAEKYFGDVDPMGKVLTVNNRFDFTVTGVLKNIPSNSILQFDMLIPFEFLKDLGRTLDEWGWNSIVTYVQLHEK